MAYYFAEFLIFYIPECPESTEVYQPILKFIPFAVYSLIKSYRNFLLKSVCVQSQYVKRNQ